MKKTIMIIGMIWAIAFALSPMAAYTRVRVSRTRGPLGLFFNASSHALRAAS